MKPEGISTCLQEISMTCWHTPWLTQQTQAHVQPYRPRSIQLCVYWGMFFFFFLSFSHDVFLRVTETFCLCCLLVCVCAMWCGQCMKWWVDSDETGRTGWMLKDASSPQPTCWAPSLGRLKPKARLSISSPLPPTFHHPLSQFVSCFFLLKEKLWKSGKRQLVSNDFLKFLFVTNWPCVLLWNVFVLMCVSLTEHI